MKRNSLLAVLLSLSLVLTSLIANAQVVTLVPAFVTQNDTVEVIFDATHSVQSPGGQGDASGGDSRFAPYLAKAATAVGIDGLFIETHPHPDEALSDGPNMVPLAQMPALWKKIAAIDAVK